MAGLQLESSEMHPFPDVLGPRPHFCHRGAMHTSSMRGEKYENLKVLKGTLFQMYSALGHISVTEGLFLSQRGYVRGGYARLRSR